MSNAGDLNETYFVGNVDEASRHLVQCTYECLDKAISIGMFRIYVIYILFLIFIKISLSLLFLNIRVVLFVKRSA